MFTLADLYSQLSYGELRNLSMAQEGNGTIKADDQPTILLGANEGLLKLFSRYVLKESTVIISLHEDITFYHLLPRFAENYTPMDSGDDEAIRYIQDTEAEPFVGDVIKILSVYEDNGVKLPLNDIENRYSVFTPQPTVLQVVVPLADTLLSIQYQARHPELTGDLDQQIELPEVLHDALRSFIAHRVYRAMGTQDSFKQASVYIASYEDVCKTAVEGDLVSTSTSTSNTRFEKRGWI